MLERGLAGEVCCSTCHGDMRQPNALLAGGSRWLVDWESATSEVPYLVDAVAFELNTERHSRAPKPHTLRTRLTALETERGFTRFDIWLATLYLQGVGHPAAANAIVDYRLETVH
jgi:thiamine kinase-like enzyme